MTEEGLNMKPNCPYTILDGINKHYKHYIYKNYDQYNYVVGSLKTHNPSIIQHFGKLH